MLVLLGILETASELWGTTWIVTIHLCTSIKRKDQQLHAQSVFDTGTSMLHICSCLYHQ